MVIYGWPKVIKCPSQDCPRSSSLMLFLATATSVKQFAGRCSVFDLNFDKFLYAETLGLTLSPPVLITLGPSGLVSSSPHYAPQIYSPQWIWSCYSYLKTSSVFPFLKTNTFGWLSICFTYTGGLLKLDSFPPTRGLCTALLLSGTLPPCSSLAFSSSQLKSHLFREAFSNPQIRSGSSVRPAPGVFPLKHLW